MWNVETIFHFYTGNRFVTVHLSHASCSSRARCNVCVWVCVWACRRISADQRASDHHLHQLQLIRHPIYSHHSLISFVRSLFVVLDVWCSRLQSCSCSRGLCIPDSSRHFGCALDSSRHFRTPLHSTHLTIKVPSLLSWFCEPAPIFLTGGLIKSIYSHTVSAFLSWQNDLTVQWKQRVALPDRWMTSWAAAYSVWILRKGTSAIQLALFRL